MSQPRFLRWRETLDERAAAAIEALASVPGVVAVLLGGSVGRGEPWPLSDVDIVPVYATGENARAERAVSARASELEAAWDAQGGRTDLDVDQIWFSRREAEEAVEWSAEQVVPHLADFRWAHGIDKVIGGRAAFDPTGVGVAFLEWARRIRFAPEVVSNNLALAGAGLERALDQAASDLRRGNDEEAAIALHSAGYLMLVHRMESARLSRSSFGRLGTRFERAMAARGQAEAARGVMDVLLLSPADVDTRFADAPEGVQQRHRLSLRARRLVGESVTGRQDRRDVLLALTTYAFRRRTTVLEGWTGVGCDRGTMNTRLEAARSARMIAP